MRLTRQSIGTEEKTDTFVKLRMHNSIKNNAYIVNI